MARQEGLEPPTPGLEGPCSIQLSYCRAIHCRARILARPAENRKTHYIRALARDSCLYHGT